MPSRQSTRALWEQLVQTGVELGARLSSQERAVRNARVATTALSRARVERDAVELYLADHEEERLAALDDAADHRIQRRREDGDRAGRVGHSGA